jgi:hypothetical protein
MSTAAATCSPAGHDHRAEHQPSLSQPLHCQNEAGALQRKPEIEPGRQHWPRPSLHARALEPCSGSRARRHRLAEERRQLPSPVIVNFELECCALV